MNTARKVTLVCGLLLAVVFGGGILFGSKRISEVRVTINAGAEEPHDAVVFGVGADSVDPDYLLKIRSGEKWIDCGTYANTKIGEGLSFEVKPLVPIHTASEIALYENDKLADDELERMPISGRELTGQSFSFSIDEQFDIQAGFAWFFDTPLGKIISAGLFVAVIVVVVTWFL